MKMKPQIQKAHIFPQISKISLKTSKIPKIHNLFPYIQEFS